MSFESSPQQGVPDNTLKNKELNLRYAGFERAFRQLNSKLPISDAGPEVPALKNAARRMIESALSKLAEIEPAQVSDITEMPFTLRLVGTWEEDATDAA